MSIDVSERTDSLVGDTASALASGAEDWAQLVERIHQGDSAAMEELYRTLSKGIRYLLCRQLGPMELDDKVHDIFVIVVQAITRGELREPERLMGFVRTVVRRQVANHIDRAIQVRRGQVDLDPALPVSDERIDPEKNYARTQKIGLMREVLRGISGRDREILTRFYLEEQSQETICSEMDLSDTQFRLLKSRAKARFAELGKKKLVRRALSTFAKEAGR